MKRRFLGVALIAGLLGAVAGEAQARGGRRGGSSSHRGRASFAGGGGGGGGSSSGGCGSRGGPGYRKANGKCASHRD